MSEVKRIVPPIDVDHAADWLIRTAAEGESISVAHAARRVVAVELLGLKRVNAKLLALCSELLGDIDDRGDPRYLMPGTANIVERIREAIAKVRVAP